MKHIRVPHKPPIPSKRKRRRKPLWTAVYDKREFRAAASALEVIERIIDAKLYGWEQSVEKIARTAGWRARQYDAWGGAYVDKLFPKRGKKAPDLRWPPRSPLSGSAAPPKPDHQDTAP